MASRRCALALKKRGRALPAHAKCQVVPALCSPESLFPLPGALFSPCLPFAVTPGPSAFPAQSRGHFLPRELAQRGSAPEEQSVQRGLRRRGLPCRAALASRQGPDHGASKARPRRSAGRVSHARWIGPGARRARAQRGVWGARLGHRPGARGARRGRAGSRG